VGSKRILKIESPALWGIITIIITVIGIVGTMLVSGSFQRKGYHLAIEMIENKVLTNVDERIAPDITVYYKTEQVPNLMLLGIRIRNSGAEGVQQGDIITPIKFTFSDPSLRVLGEAAVSNNPRHVIVDQALSEDRRELELAFSLLNKGWFFEMSILYTGQKLSIPTVYAQIKNISENEVTTLQDLTELTKEQSVVKRRLETGWIRLGVGMVLLGTLCACFIIFASWLVWKPGSAGYALADKLVGKIGLAKVFLLALYLAFWPIFLYIFGVYLGMYGYWKLMNEYGVNKTDLRIFIMFGISLTILTCMVIAFSIFGLVKFIKGRHK